MGSTTESIILSDGKREILSTEFDDLKDSTAPTTSEPCSFLTTDGKVKWAECTGSHRYLCEYKGDLQKSY